MEILFARSWRVLALRGLAGLLFGLLAFVWPSMTLVAATLLFGAYPIADGILAIAAGTRRRGHEHVWMFALEGLAGVAVGLAAFAWAGMRTPLLVDLICALGDRHWDSRGRHRISPAS